MKMRGWGSGDQGIRLSGKQGSRESGDQEIRKSGGKNEGRRTREEGRYCPALFPTDSVGSVPLQR